MEIAIIGAGPAGAMAAVRLARAGLNVALFDPSHPREKPCGGGFTGRALKLVSDVLDISALPAVVVKSAQIEDPDRREVTKPAIVALADWGLTPASSLIVMSRAVFDNALTTAAVNAGAEMIAERVVQVTRCNGKMTVRTPANEYRTDFVLGADGANSLVRKAMARPFLRSEISIAAGHFVHHRSSSDIAIKCVSEQPGYLWSFPRPDHLAVGSCAPASEHVTSGELRDQSLAWINNHLGRRELVEPYAWPIPSIGGSAGHQVNNAGGPGWMLLGDAAGLVDPLTREGIYYALLSGQWAAEAITRSPERAHSRYTDRLMEEIYPELRRAATLSDMFFSTTFSSLLVEALRQSASIREVFADLVAGTQPYTGLWGRLLATGEWTLATRAAQIAFRRRKNPGISGTIISDILPTEASPRS